MVLPRSYHHNIFHLYLIKLAKWLMLIMPVVALFYVENGLETTDILLLQAIYSFSVACMEIPSGYMADIIGRKKSLVMGSILGTLGFVVYASSHSFNGFLLAEIILGLGGSFISGSDSALLFDSLVVLREEQSYLRLEGRITAIGNLAETLAAIAGGLIAAFISYRAVYICQSCIAAVAIPASLLLLEPPRKKLKDRPGFKQILDICHQAFYLDKPLRSTILLSAVAGTATLCMAWTAQVYFVSKGLDEKSITPLWVGLNLVVALVAAQAARIKDYIGNKAAMLGIMILLPGGYFLLGLLPLIPGLLALLLFYVVRGYATPLLKDMINHHCSSDIRATVLSCRSLLIRLSFSILGPAIGILSGRFSLSIALMATGLGLGAAFLAAWWTAKKHLDLF